MVSFDETFENYFAMMEKIVYTIKDIMQSSIHLHKNITKLNQKIVWNIGFDFMFDKYQNVYLIEMNHDPSLNDFFYFAYDFSNKCVYSFFK